MGLRAGLVGVLVVLLAASAGCGGSGSGSAAGTTTGVTVTIPTTTQATTTAPPPASSQASCRKLRSAAKQATSSIASALPSFASVRSRSQLVSRLRVLQNRISAAAGQVDGVVTSSPPLRRDQRKLSAALRDLSRTVGAARTAVAQGNLSAAAKLNASAALGNLHSAAADLSRRCG